MGKVRAPHQTIDVDLVAQLDADAVELKAPVKMLAYIFAGRPSEWFEPEQPFGPTVMAILAHVGGLKKKRNPADLVFGEEDAQGWKPIEESGQDPLYRSHRAVAAHRTETAHLIDQIVGDFAHDLFGFPGVLEERAFAFAGAVEIDVDADRHVQFQCARPKNIVFNRWISFPAGKALK